MSSAGSALKIDVITDSYPIIKPEIIGTALVRVEDFGFLKYPREQS
jgi:hypothetical protein